MAHIDLLEAGEATAVVGAILWLVQTILETLQPGDLDAWLSRVGLAGAIGELKSEVERMETVVNGVGERAVGNKPLARSLARVKELMYDADDVVDELDYRRLQQQVQGVTLAPHIELEGMVGDGDNSDEAEHADASASTADISDDNQRKNRCKERDYFHITPAANGQPARAKCIDCGTQVVFSHGTSVLRKHRNIASCKKKRAAIEEAPNCPSAGDSVQNGATVSTNDSEGRKRMRTEYITATTTQLGGKAEFLKRIQEIALELASIRGYVIEYLKDSIAMSNQCQINDSDTRVRTSSSPTGKVYGMDLEKEEIISAIKDVESDNITVIPIVGIIGVGKTTLAKFVYHDQHVEREFERIWVWVSNIFDEVRVTREILDIVTLASHEGSHKRDSYEGVSNYSKLLEVLKKHMSCLSKKFLLVLDDVCDSQWKDLIDALGSSCRKGNVIIVTTRNLSIAKRLGTIEPVELKALGNDDFLQLFSACAFGDKNYKEHLDTSRQICAKLKGNPLAAKSAVEMLREQPSLDHWKNIIKNGIWESLQLHGGIVTALKNIYYHLPYHLQQCFLVCSVFPSDHQFHIDDLVSMWISLGFVKSIEAGRDYLNTFVNSCFFEQVGTEGDSILQQCYIMCGMMHEFARLVSRTEFATIDGLECKEVLPTVRHLSIQTDLVYYLDVCENIGGNEKFEEKLQSIASSLRRLRTVILVGHYDSFFVQFKSFHTFFSNLVNCTHLRYLKLENKGNTECLPISLSKFYHLEILDARCRAIVHDMSDLRSMRHLVLINGAFEASFLARLASLQTIHLEDYEGQEILPLENLSSLTKLKLRNMMEVTELLIPSLEELVLIGMPKLDRCRFSSPVKDLNSSLRVLEISICRVLKAFPLFERCEHFEIEQKSWLPNITELTIHHCPGLVVSNPLPPSSSLCKLSIRGVSTLPTIEGSSNGGFEIGDCWDPSSINFLDNKILSFHNLRTITRLETVCCQNLLYISLLEGLKQLVCLKRLKIRHCQEIVSSNVPSTHTHEDMAATNLDALPSLECLSITNCGTTGQWLSVILQHVRALEELHLKFHGNREGFSGFTSLKELRIMHCPEPISSLVHGDEMDDQAKGRWLLPSSLGVLYINVDDYSLGTLQLQPCFPGDLTCLTALEVSGNELKSLQLRSCTALEYLTIQCCERLDALEGVQSLRSLRYLDIYGCPDLSQCLESLSTQGYELCPRLERLRTDDLSILTTPFCKHLTSLQCLCLRFRDGFRGIDVARLTCEQEAALQLLTSLQQLRFFNYRELSDLPGVLHSLLSLKRLEMFYCPSISKLPERGLPSSLEELEISECSDELSEQCRKVATSKLKVIIDKEYVN